MAARFCANPDCGRDISHRRPQSTTCGHRCRSKVHRDSRACLRDELRDIAMKLVRDGEIDAEDAFTLTLFPTARILEALEARRQAA